MKSIELIGELPVSPNENAWIMMGIPSLLNPKVSIHMSGGQKYFLLSMDMAKVGGPLSVVKVFTQI